MKKFKTSTLAALISAAALALGSSAVLAKGGEGGGRGGGAGASNSGGASGASGARGGSAGASSSARGSSSTADGARAGGRSFGMGQATAAGASPAAASTGDRAGVDASTTGLGADRARDGASVSDTARNSDNPGAALGDRGVGPDGAPGQPQGTPGTGSSNDASMGNRQDQAPNSATGLGADRARDGASVSDTARNSDNPGADLGGRGVGLEGAPGQAR